MSRSSKSTPILGALLVVVVVTIAAAAALMGNSAGVSSAPTEVPGSAPEDAAGEGEQVPLPMPTQIIPPTAIPPTAIPPTAMPPTAIPAVTTYTVEAGDSAAYIVSKFGYFSLEDLKSANPEIADIAWIYPGQIINLPTQQTVLEDNSADTGVYGKEDVLRVWESVPPPTVSGGNVVQRGKFWEFSDQFLRVLAAENGETAWSSLIKIDGWNPSIPSVLNGCSFYWPEDYLFSGEGTCSLTFTLKADNTENGYDKAASYGDTGKLSVYVTGMNGTVYLSKDNGATWKKFELSSGKPGIDFPKDSVIMFRIDLGSTSGKGMYSLSIGPQDSTGDAPAY